MLEALEHAQDRGAKIYAEIKVYGATCDAYHRVVLRIRGRAGTRDELALKGRGSSARRSYYVTFQAPPQCHDRIGTLHSTRFDGRAILTPMSATKSQSDIRRAQVRRGPGRCSVRHGDRNDSADDQPGRADPRCDLDYVPNKARQADVKSRFVTASVLDRRIARW